MWGLRARALYDFGHPVAPSLRARPIQRSSIRSGCRRSRRSTALSFAGLVAIYAISRNPITSHLYNSSDRTIDALVIGSALLVPVLLHAEDAERRFGDRGVEGG
jgi:hypothetical protein